MKKTIFRKPIKALIAHHQTVSAVAIELGISRPSVTRIMDGIQEPSYSLGVRILEQARRIEG